MARLRSLQEQGTIWDFYKPRHTHAWNMLVISWRELDELTNEMALGFEPEYHWENFIIRLWLYRGVIKTMKNLDIVANGVDAALAKFDRAFDANGRNGLKALRDMIEHFDDYAAGDGHGPATRDRDLDPWRTLTKDTYVRGQFSLERSKSYEAAIQLRADAKRLSEQFIVWFKASQSSQ